MQELTPEDVEQLELDAIIAAANKKKAELALKKEERLKEEFGDQLKKSRDELKEFHDLIWEKTLAIESAQRDVAKRIEKKLQEENVLNHELKEYCAGLQFQSDSIMNLLSDDLKRLNAKIDRYDKGEPIEEETKEVKKEK